MTTVEELGLDSERLQRRIGFLESRATAHMEREIDPHDRPRRDLERACAAGLWRDAAALALLLDDPKRARTFLRKAGVQWAELGLFAGYSLMALADRDPWWTERRADIDAVLQTLRLQTERPEESAERGRTRGDELEAQTLHRQPLIVASAGSTRQLLHLYQSLVAKRDTDPEVQATTALVRKRLEESPAAPVGPTGVPLDAYLDLLDAASHGDVGGSVADSVSGLVMRRAEQLQAARRDEYHWRLALKPAELVDFDLLAIATTSLDVRQTDEPFADRFRARGGGVELPMRAARGLRGQAPP